MRCRSLIDQLHRDHTLTHVQWCTLLSTYDEEDRAYAAALARSIAEVHYGKTVFIRGIVEFSNICKNDCLYCGIRRSNAAVARYRLTKDEILACCDEGYATGFRTFVLQSGEDGAYTPVLLAEIVSAIKAKYPDCAVTLSVGELEYDALRMLRAAGADRYLLRHETADEAHYARLHPDTMSFAHRMQCLRDLKSLGFQTGAGMMIGSPYQTVDCLAEDMLFLTELQPEMVGIGPFLPQCDTPFRGAPAGSVELTLFLLSLTRILLPHVLLPATTALGTAQADGRIQGVLAGANVIMPNLSPLAVREKYMLYDNKSGTEQTASEVLALLRTQLQQAGYTISNARGDHKA